jgi:predicted signal transduction protein with EAL and GGDEF domain
VLSTVAERLRATVRQGDEVSRLGGDEFTVLLPGLTDAEAAKTLSRKILEVLAEPIELPEQRLVITASIGICIYPVDGDNAADLLRNADSAMYRAKRTGRNTFSRYEPVMTERALTRVSLESDLRQALAKGDLSVAYQPQVDMRSGALLGAEALLRWNHSSRGYISPEEFIPIAEETGIIRDLGYWVLDQVCETAGTLELNGCRDLTFAVNVSARQLLDDAFPAHVMALVRESGCKNSNLELEITESVLIQNPARARKILDELRASGITFAVDDFGTGYSSLAYLKQYPISKLKIDASFVRDLAEDISDRAIADAVIALARSLSLKVIAEGVETEAQRDILLTDGCYLAQGFLFYEPLPKEDFLAIATAAAA